MAQFRLGSNKFVSYTQAVYAAPCVLQLSLLCSFLAQNPKRFSQKSAENVTLSVDLSIIWPHQLLTFLASLSL